MESSDITFRTRKWVRPEDLNANGILFGGSLLKWIDEEAAIYAILQPGNGRAVTKYISEINFVSSAVQGELIEMGLTATKLAPWPDLHLGARGSGPFRDAGLMGRRLGAFCRSTGQM